MKITEQKINQTISETIRAMTMDRQTEMIDGLRTLAGWWKTAGGRVMGQSFVDLCAYMEAEAVDQAGTEMVRVRVAVALDEARKTRIMVLQ